MSKHKVNVEVPATTEAAPRLLTQHIDYVARPGKNITKYKTELMDSVMEDVATALGNRLGFDVVNVDSQEH